MPRIDSADGVLDCESLDSALASLSCLLGIKKRELKTNLLRIKPDEFETNPNREIEWKRDLWNRLMGSATSAPAPRIIHWFHATRVPPETDFKEGILPLNMILPTLLPQ